MLLLIQKYKHQVLISLVPIKHLARMFSFRHLAVKPYGKCISSSINVELQELYLLSEISRLLAVEENKHFFCSNQISMNLCLLTNLNGLYRFLLLFLGSFSYDIQRIVLICFYSCTCMFSTHMSIEIICEFLFLIGAKFCDICLNTEIFAYDIFNSLFQQARMCENKF